MHRRVGQHEAQPIQPRRHRPGQGFEACLQQHDGRLGRGEKLGLGLAHLGMGADHIQIARHQRKGLVGPPLALTQGLDHIGAGRIAGQVKAAQPLHGDDMAVHQRTAGGIHIVHHRKRFEVHGAPAQLFQPGAGAADMAGDGLGVKPAVAGVFIFGAAIGAHLERRHRRGGPVIGRFADDRQARAAIRTVGKRIAIAPLERVAGLFQTVGADGHVGRHRDAVRSRLGRSYFEIVRGIVGNAIGFNGVDPGQLWQRRAQPYLEPVGHFPPKTDFHAARCVPDIAGEVHFTGQPPDRGAKADPLHLSLHDQAEARELFRSQPGHGAIFHNNTRLFPLSATATRPSRAPRP